MYVSYILKKKSSKCGHLNFLYSKFSAQEYFIQDSENLLFIWMTSQ